MKFFKALREWLGSKERQETITEYPVIPATDQTFTGELKERLYKVRKHVGDDTIVIMKDGTSYQAEDKLFKIWEALDDIRYEEDIKLLFIPTEQKKEGKKEVIAAQDLTALLVSKDFRVDGERVYLRGTNVPIPAVIVAEFIEILEKQLALVRSEASHTLDGMGSIDNSLAEKYNRLIFFWLKLANSPVADIENVLLYCKENDVRLSKTGNIIAYRRVETYKVVTEEDKRWEFVSAQYQKIRKVWKKNPADFLVVKIDGEYSLHKMKKNDAIPPSEGTLHDLFLKGNTSIGSKLYTSAHNRGKYAFPIPSLYKMEGENPNPNIGNCAAGGLHAANVNYDYSGYGDVPVVVLVNPMRAIHTPIHENGKFRTSEMYIAAINPNPTRGVHIEEALIEEADEIYNQISIDQLKEVLISKNVSDISAMEHVPSTSLRDIADITKLLESRTIKI